MAQKTQIVAAACAATLVLLSAPAGADTDRLPAERMTAIKIAFDDVLANPEADVDRLSAARLETVAFAYKSHDPDPDADRLPPARWLAMKAAYKTHDPDFARIALAE